jgi:hypothetical protein
MKASQSLLKRVGDSGRVIDFFFYKRPAFDLRAGLSM